MVSNWKLTVDPEGRVRLPKEFTELYGVEPGDVLGLEAITISMAELYVPVKKDDRHMEVQP